jgi:hypothetical protein
MQADSLDDLPRQNLKRLGNAWNNSKHFNFVKKIQQGSLAFKKLKRLKCLKRLGGVTIKNRLTGKLPDC